MHPAELGELEAFRDLYAAAPPELGARTAEIGGALCLRLDPLSAVTMFNRVLCLASRPRRPTSSSKRRSISCRACRRT